MKDLFMKDNLTNESTKISFMEKNSNRDIRLIECNEMKSKEILKDVSKKVRENN